MHATVSSARALTMVALLGLVASTGHNVEIDDVINKDPQAKQVGTVVVDTDTASHEYTGKVNGVEVSYTAGGTTSTALIAAGLAAAINAEPLVRGQVVASANSATVTITATNPNIAFTLTDWDAKTTATQATTAAAAADTIPFGRVVLATGYTGQSKTGALCKAARLSAQVDSYVLTYDASVITHVKVEIGGQTYADAYIQATNLATAVTAIKDLINDMMPANSVVATETGGTTVILTAEVPGTPFKSSITPGSAHDTFAAVKTSTEGALLTDINKAALGISTHGYNVEASTPGSSATEWPANGGCPVLKRGPIWVADPGSVSKGDPVYIETVAGATSGRLYKTGSATRIRWERATWEQSASPSTDGLALVTLA